MKQLSKKLRKSKWLSILWAMFAVLFSKVLFWLVDSQEMELSDLVSIPFLGTVIGLSAWSLANFIYSKG